MGFFIIITLNLNKFKNYCYEYKMQDLINFDRLFKENMDYINNHKSI